jgi:post-segregation antitoxin (ccd killing protein)
VRACILHASIGDVRKVNPIRTADVQLRGVPVALREKLRARARRRGLSMSRYAIEVLERELSRPSLEEWLAEVSRQPRTTLRISAAQAIREARAEEGRA